MTPDDLPNLLTAAVDGELTPAEAARVRALLAESADARAAFRKLKADRKRLRALTPHTPPPDLRARIMARIPSRPPVPAEIARPHVRPRRGSLVPVGVAASVLLALGGGSFAYFLNEPDAGPRGAVAVARVDVQSERHWAKVLPPETAPPPSAPAPLVEPPPELPRAAVASETPAVPEVAPQPRPVVRDVLTFPPLPDVPKLDLALVRVPFLTTFAEFERDDIQQQLLAELKQDPAFRVDLFARDPGRAAELLQSVARGSGLTVHTDRMTADRVQRKLAVAYLMYTDSLTAEELHALLVRLAVTDLKFPQPTFAALHVAPATAGDQRDLRDTLGTDPGLWKRPAAATEPKSVASGTADRVARTLTDPAGKGGEKSALVMTFAPTTARTAPSTSAELRTYLARRGDRRPTAVPVVIVIRQSAG